MTRPVKPSASSSPKRDLKVNDPLLTKEEVAAILGVTEYKVIRMTRRREIDFVKVGKLIRFRQSAVAAVIEAGTVTAISK